MFETLFCQHEYRNQYERRDGTVVEGTAVLRGDYDTSVLLYRVYRCMHCPKILRRVHYHLRMPRRPA